MKYLFVFAALLVLAVGVSAPAQAQTSNVLLISQDAGTKVITVVKAADPGVTGTWLSYSSQISATGSAIENKLFSGIPSGQMLLVKIDANKTMTVMLVNNPYVTGSFVAVDTNLAGVVGAVKNALYLGL